MIYTFKPRPELVRAVGLALGTFLLEALSDPRLATDPRGWAIAAGIGAGHVVVAAILGLYSAPQGQPGQVPAMPTTPRVDPLPVALRTGVVYDARTGEPLRDEPQFGTADVRVGQSAPAPAPAPAPVPAAPPAPSADELRHQRRRDSALKGWDTRRAEAATPPPAVPDKPRARVRKQP